MLLGGVEEALLQVPGGRAGDAVFASEAGGGGELAGVEALRTIDPDVQRQAGAVQGSASCDGLLAAAATAFLHTRASSRADPIAAVVATGPAVEAGGAEAEESEAAGQAMVIVRSRRHGAEVPREDGCEAS
jgi:hypothetical protein